MTPSSLSLGIFLRYFEKFTRLEILDETGRAYTLWNCKIDASVQDQGQTLKLFLSHR